MEGLRLRVKDVEFERRELVVRNGQDGNARSTVLPGNWMLPLRVQLMQAKTLHNAACITACRARGCRVCQCRMRWQ